MTRLSAEGAAHDLEPHSYEAAVCAVAGFWKVNGDDIEKSAGTSSHDDDGVREVDRFLDVVRHQEGRRSLGGEYRCEFLLQNCLGMSVQRSERLIHQQNFWKIDQSPRQRDALHHSAGELIGPCTGEISETKQANEPSGRRRHAQKSAADRPAKAILSDTLAQGRRRGS